MATWTCPDKAGKTHRCSREGKGWPLSAGAAKAVPTFILLPDVSDPLCVPVSRLPQRRDRVPSRCGLPLHRAWCVKAAQEGMWGGEGALAWP